MILNFLLFIFFAATTINAANSHIRPWNKKLTILVDPGSRDCFHFPNITAHSHILSVMFRVLGGAGGLGGALNLAAVDLYDPQGRMQESVSDAASGDFRIKAVLSGDYALCVDNAASSLSHSAKTVYLGVSAELVRRDDDLYGDEYYYEGDDYFDREELEAMHEVDVKQESDFQMKVEDIKSLLRRIRLNVASAEEQQGHFNLAHSRDFRNVVETGERADRWGAAHTAAVVATALMQVVVVRTFFGYGIKTWRR